MKHEQAPTLGALFAAYSDYATQRQLRSLGAMRGTFNRYLRNRAERNALTITGDEVEALQGELAARVSAKTANSVTELLSTVYNRAIADGVIPDFNPVRGIRKLSLEKRDRKLEPDEMPRFFRALNSVKSRTIRDFIIVCLLSGEQKSKVLTMRRDVDLDHGILFIPSRTHNPRDVRTLEPRAKYLVDELVNVLRQRRESVRSEFVFPSVCSHQECSGNCRLSDTGHLRGPDKSWAALMKRANIENLRLNDLRNSFLNLGPVRDAMSEHYYSAPSRRFATRGAERDVARVDAESMTRQRKAKREAVAKAIASPVEEAPLRLVLSPSGESAAPAFSEAFEYYVERHGNSCRSAIKIRQLYERFIKPSIGARAVDQLRPSDILSLRDFIGCACGNASANRVLEIISATYNRCKRWQVIDAKNPCEAVEKFNLEARQRFLSRAEIFAQTKRSRRLPRRIKPPPHTFKHCVGLVSDNTGGAAHAESRRNSARRASYHDYRKPH